MQKKSTGGTVLAILLVFILIGSIATCGGRRDSGGMDSPHENGRP